MIIKKDKVLLGKRLNNYGKGEYTFPGGRLEQLETFAMCARREVKEECGLEIKNLKPQFVSNVIKYKPKHYFHLGVVAKWYRGRPKLLEPDKFEHWRWFSLDKLPKPLFEMCRLAIESYKTGQWFFESKKITKKTSLVKKRKKPSK